MKDKNQRIISIIIGLAGVFLLGGYTAGTLRHNEVIELHKWIITCLVTISFLLYGFRLEIMKESK